MAIKEYPSATIPSQTGNSGKYLTTNGSVPSWGTVGGMTELASGTFSGSAVDFTSISGAYRDLVIYVRNVRPNTDGSTIRMRVNGITASDGYFIAAFNAAVVTESAWSASSVQIGTSTDSTTNNGFAWVQLKDYANALTWKWGQFRVVHSADATTTNLSNLKSDFYVNTTNAITSISIYPSAGTFNGGTYILYGVK